MSDATERGKPAGGVVDEFEQLLYWLNISDADFDGARFRQSLPAGAQVNDDGALTFNSRDPQFGRFHCRLTWRFQSNRVRLHIAFHSGPGRRDDSETEPYAEDFVSWLGSFFAQSAVSAHFHARLRYPSDRFKPSFPLQLSRPAPLDAELVGAAFRFRERTDGVTALRLNEGARHYYSEVIGDSTFVFGSFDVDGDILRSANILQSFFQEEQS